MEEHILQSVLRLSRVVEHFHRQRIEWAAQPIIQKAEGTLIAEANPQAGLLMESLMATVAQSDKEAKRRIRAFLDHKTAKVKPRT